MLIFRKKRPDGSYNTDQPSVVLISGQKKEVERALNQLVQEDRVVVACGSRALVLFMLGIIRTQVPIRIETEDGLVIVEHLLTVEETLTRWTDPEYGLPIDRVEEILQDTFVSAKVKTTLREKLSGLSEKHSYSEVKKMVEDVFRDVYPEGDPSERFDESGEV